MIGVALGVDALEQQRRIVAQSRGNFCRNLGPGDAIGEIGLGAKQRLPVLAGERRGAGGAAPSARAASAGRRGKYDRPL